MSNGCSVMGCKEPKRWGHHFDCPAGLIAWLDEPVSGATE